MPSKQWQRCVLRFGSEKDIFDEFDTDFTGKLLGMNSLNWNRSLWGSVYIDIDLYSDVRTL